MLWTHKKYFRCEYGNIHDNALGRHNSIKKHIKAASSKKQYFRLRISQKSQKRRKRYGRKKVTNQNYIQRRAQIWDMKKFEFREDGEKMLQKMHLKLSSKFGYSAQLQKNSEWTMQQKSLKLLLNEKYLDGLMSMKKWIKYILPVLRTRAANVKN